MIGWLGAGAVVITYEAWALIKGRDTMTHVVRCHTNHPVKKAAGIGVLAYLAWHFFR